MGALNLAPLWGNRLTCLWRSDFVDLTGTQGWFVNKTPFVLTALDLKSEVCRLVQQNATVVDTITTTDYLFCPTISLLMLFTVTAVAVLFEWEHFITQRCRYDTLKTDESSWKHAAAAKSTQKESPLN